jgi:hypothetical protein
VGRYVLYDPGVDECLPELQLLLLYLLHQLPLLLQFQLPILPDGLVILHAIVPHHQSFVLLVPPQLLADLLSLAFLPLLDLTDLLLAEAQVLVVGVVLAGSEGVRLEEVELVAGGEEGQLDHGVDRLRLARLQLDQLVQGPPRLFYLGLQVRKILQLHLEV